MGMVPECNSIKPNWVLILFLFSAPSVLTSCSFLHFVSFLIHQIHVCFFRLMLFTKFTSAMIKAVYIVHYLQYVDYISSHHLPSHQGSLTLKSCRSFLIDALFLASYQTHALFIFPTYQIKIH